VGREYLSSTKKEESNKKVQAPFFYSTLTAKVFFCQKYVMSPREKKIEQWLWKIAKDKKAVFEE
jgi:hypothetical protein